LEQLATDSVQKRLWQRSGAEEEADGGLAVESAMLSLWILMLLPKVM
jgi:hypothetical protein